MKFLNRFKRKNQSDLPGEPGASAVPQGDVPAGSADGGENPKSAPPDEVCLRLGDFLHRIPAHLLQAGPHDLQKEIRFTINSLSERIKRGETTINLAEIYRQLPEIFRSEVRDADKQQILYPWRKVISMIKDANLDRGSATDAVAANLAEKIRQKKPVIRPGGTTGASAGPQTPILRGRGKQQASWFSRTTIEKGEMTGSGTPAEPVGATPELASSDSRPSEMNAAAKGTGMDSKTDGPPPEIPLTSAAPLRATNSPSDPTQPDSSEKRLKLVTSHQPASPASPDAPAPTEAPAPSVAPLNRPAEPDPRLAELPPVLQRRVAVIKGDYERQLAELELARKTYAAEVDRLQTQLAQTADRLDEERTANAVSRDLLQQSARDRDATQQQIAELRQKMDAAQKDSRLSAITAERDALLQQKAHLSSQISELSKRGASAMPRGGDATGTSAVLQRQVDEFQRRISLMEAAQRDTALELAREKEARAKAEKLLAAAEKLQEQSANYMETAKGEIRKEIEASVKPREIEARKIQKELQDQIAQLTDQNRRLATDLENAKANLANATASPAPSPADGIQSQAIAQLEQDIENYRERLKSLLKERDAARAEAKSLAANVSNPSETEELSTTQARLQEELENVRKERAEQARVLETLRRERATSEERFAAERASFEKHLASLQQSVDAAQHAHAAQIAALEKAAEERKHAERISGSTAIAELQVQADEALAAAKAATDELTELRRRFDEQTTSSAELAAELQRERASSAAEREATATRLREESHSLEQQLAKAVEERNELERKHADALAQSQSDQATRDELLANLERDHTSTVRAKEELSQRLAEAERALRALEKNQENLARTGDGLLGDPALITANSGLRAQVAELEQQRDGAKNELSTQRADAERAAADLANSKTERDQLVTKLEILAKEREDTVARISAERDTAREQNESLNRELAARNAALEEARAKESKLESDFASARQRLIAERATEIGSREEAIKRLSEERDQANAGRTAALQDLEQERQKSTALKSAEAMLAEERQKFASERADLENQVAASAKTATQVVQQSATELAESHANLENAKRALAAAEARGDRLEKQIAELNAGVQRGNEQVEQLRRRLEAAQEEAATALQNVARRHEEDSSRARREIASLHTERDNLSKQRDELLRRLTRMTEDDKRLLDDLMSAPQVMPAPTVTEERQPSNVIEVTIPEVLPPEPGNGIAIPRVRPMAVPPPKVHTL